jgi:diguanylate cyclase (GGDEF)-like protein
MVATLVGLFVSAMVVTAVMARRNLRNWRAASSYVVVIGVMNALVSAINAMAALQVLLPYRTGALVVLSVQTVLMPICMATVTVMAMTVADRTWHLTRRTVLWLGVWPVIMLTAVATNHWHHLVYKRIRPIGFGDMYLPHPQEDVGPIFLAGTAYVLLLVCITAGRVFLIRRRATTPAQRRACGMILIAFVPACAVSVLNQVLVAAVETTVVDLVPLGQTLTMLYVQARLIKTIPQQIPVPHRQVFAAISDAIMVVDRAHRIIEVNQAADNLLHRLNPSLPADLTGYQTRQVAQFDLREDELTEHIITDAADSGLDLHLVINPLYDRRACIGWALVIRDISESNRRRREAEEAATRLREQLSTIEALQADLAAQATVDALTGLHNRRYLMEQLDRDVPRLGHAATASLAIIDLDHFKQINDTYGHSGGDAVLVRVGELLTAAVRDGDVVARYGGEEFVLYMHGADLSTAWERLEELRRLVKNTLIEANGSAIAATFSAGVVEFLPGLGGEELLRMADEALYEAKRSGRDRVERAAARVPAAALSLG